MIADGAIADGAARSSDAGPTPVEGGADAVVPAPDSGPAQLDAGCSSRAEECNGADDDCDGMIDDGFECRAGETAPCAVCGFSGSRQCVGCALEPTCRGVAVSLRYEGNDGALGHTCAGSVACDSDWCACGAGECYVQYGPYVALPAGRYHVAILLGVSGTGDLLLDAFDSTTGAALYSSAITAGLGAFTYEYDVSVPDGCHAIEFRVYTHTTACVRLYDTTVRRTGD